MENGRIVGAGSGRASHEPSGRSRSISRRPRCQRAFGVDRSPLVVSNPPTDAGRVVETLIAHSAVRRINFTGASNVDKIVAKSSAEHLLPVPLQLGGKARSATHPFLVTWPVFVAGGAAPTAERIDAAGACGVDHAGTLTRPGGRGS